MMVTEPLPPKLLPLMAPAPVTCPDGQRGHVDVGRAAGHAIHAGDVLGLGAAAGDDEPASLPVEQRLRIELGLVADVVDALVQLVDLRLNGLPVAGSQRVVGSLEAQLPLLLQHPLLALDSGAGGGELVDGHAGVVLRLPQPIDLRGELLRYRHTGRVDRRAYEPVAARQLGEQDRLPLLELRQDAEDA